MPLALAQAGAYLETTGTSLTRYRQSYQRHRAELLREHHSLTQEHPKPVGTTWNISFERVAEQNPTAIEVLRLCAFLAPDAIPEEIFTEGGKALGASLEAVCTDTYLFDQAIRALRAYSLLTRNPQERTLSVHRLLQAVISDALPAEVQREWKQRAVLAVNAAFLSIESNLWQKCERLLPHALQCATWIEQEQIDISESASLLYETGVYLQERGLYREAEPLFLRSLHIDERTLGPEHPDTWAALYQLGYLSQAQGKFVEAEAFQLRALRIDEQASGPEHPDIVISLDALICLYWIQNKYEEAEAFQQRVLRISEQALGPEHPDTAITLYLLATLYQDQSKYTEAKPLFLHALRILDQVLGPEHPSIAITLHALARLYQAQGKFTEAEPLFLRAFTVFEQTLGPEHPYTQITQNNCTTLRGVMQSL